MWTFGKKLGLGFAIALFITLTIGMIGVQALRSVVADKDQVIDVHAKIQVDAERVNSALEAKVAAMRGFLLAPNPARQRRMQDRREEFLTVVEQLKRRELTATSAQLLREIEASEAEHQAESEQVLAARRAGASFEEVARLLDEKVQPKRDELTRQLNALLAAERQLLDSSRREASEGAHAAIRSVVVLAALATFLALVTAILLTRTLSRQIGSAVQHVLSSSSELQTAANQQAAGSKEQSTAMIEITTTINELLATSKQIAESAQRVAHIAEETARAAREGHKTVDDSGESMGTIKRQVDLIVMHMLDLGKKSQQIGGILEIINELSEQTNILAINATIEAAGAGESGRRFAVVADEIRKLADRVGKSTKEIRNLIEEVRAAVNTTVMTTEGGTKAVDAGTRQFADVAAAFQQIVDSVTTTTQAAREIGLSTKQQSTAVEQVNIAISNVAQATKETEASASQTLQTASQLTGLARDLMRLVRPRTQA